MNAWRAAILAVPFLFTGCAGKEELAAYYAAANLPMVDITLPAPEGGEYKIVTRRPDIRQYESQIVRGLREIGSILKSPVAGIVAVGTAVLPNAGGNTSTEVGGDQQTGGGDFKTQEDHWPVEVKEVPVETR